MPAVPSGRPAPLDASSPVSPESAARDFLNSLTTPCRLLIAYSGGGDSTGLLVALAACLKSEPGLDISLFAATVDHGLRADSADEARNAGMLCERLGIPHRVLAWDGEKPVAGLQAAAREARYRLLAEHADMLGADLIATAHTSDDQAETVAMRKARSPDATGGISRAVLYDRRFWIMRPFLDVRRDGIRAYLTAQGIGWVDDPSNENDAFERVRVRKSLMRGDAEPAVHADRGTQSHEVAAFLLSHAKIHSWRVAEVDLSDFDGAKPGHLQAVLYLAAVMGGRTHPAGRETAERIAGFLASDEKRLTAERVVFERRRELLYIVRERRGLPCIEIAARAGLAPSSPRRGEGGPQGSGATPVAPGMRGRREHDPRYSHLPHRSPPHPSFGHLLPAGEKMEIKLPASGHVENTPDEEMSAGSPESTAIWDNRFRIRNHGPEPLFIGVRDHENGTIPLITSALPEDLPKSVRNRILETEPIVIQGRFHSATTEPILAPFDRFLPLDLLEIANALAFLGGLAHFPRLPTR